MFNLVTLYQVTLCPSQVFLKSLKGDRGPRPCLVSLQIPSPCSTGMALCLEENPDPAFTLFPKCQNCLAVWCGKHMDGSFYQPH